MFSFRASGFYDSGCEVPPNPRPIPDAVVPCSPALAVWGFTFAE